MDNIGRIEIRVSGPKKDHELGIFLPWDANIDDWISAFKTILIHETFPEDTVKELFGEESYNEDKERKYRQIMEFSDKSAFDEQELTYANAY